MIITENNNENEEEELINYFRKVDQDFDNKTSLIFEKIKDSIERFKLVEKNSIKDIIRDSLQNHTSYLYPTSYIFTLNRQIDYILYVNDEKYKISKKKLRKYMYITISYNYYKNIYVMTYSNYRRKFM